MKAAISGTCLAAGIVVTAMLAIPISSSMAEAAVPPRYEARAVLEASDIQMGDWFKAQSENAQRIEEAIKKQKEEQEAAAAAEAARIAEEQAAQEVYYEPYYDGGYSGGGSGGRGSNSYNGDGFAFEGVRDYNGTTETWYSSNQAYHYRTGEWTADDEGYYRDSEGYYVVASEDHAEGEVFDTSKGKAKVYDGGCDNGVTDFYVCF